MKLQLTRIKLLIGLLQRFLLRNDIPNARQPMCDKREAHLLNKRVNDI
jgi:hypothetical protein